MILIQGCLNISPFCGPPSVVTVLFRPFSLVGPGGGCFPPSSPCFFFFSGINAAAASMMDPNFMQDAMEMMKDPEVLKQVSVCVAVAVVERRGS